MYEKLLHWLREFVEKYLIGNDDDFTPPGASA